MRLGTRQYGQKVSARVGPKFRNLTEIKDYLARPCWSVAENIQISSKEGMRIVPKATVEKLLKLSGLPIKDVEGFQQKLGRQLAFIDQLQSLPVGENVDPSHARMMKREPVPLEFDQLMESILQQDLQKSKDLGETENSWKCTDLAAIKENGFYVLREGLLKNRE